MRGISTGLILAVLLAILVVIYGHWRYTTGYKTATSEYQLASAEASARQEQKNRAIETQHNQTIAKIASTTSQQLQDAYNNAAVARDDADRLRREVRNYAGQLRNTTHNTCTSAGSKATATDPGVLAELFRRTDERAQRLAEIADESRVRGLACEQMYDSLTKGP